MLDLDHFKNLNDTYGHIIGDEVLIMVGKILKNHESNHVKIGRYGGEEFILYIGNETFENAERAMEQIRRDIEEACLILEKGKRIRVTVSIGYAPIEKNAPVLKSVNQADKNLYLAKMSGRNQVISPQKASRLKTS